MENLSSHILFSDHYYLLVNKPSGLPVQEDKTGDASLLRLMQAYCKHNLYLIHRIDRPVSGAVLFAKNKETQALMNEDLSKSLFSKTYLAIVPIIDLDETGSFRDALIHDKKKMMAKVDETGTHKESRKAILHYKIIQTLDHFRLLEIKTETGRFHQIRAQLAFHKMPIRGDVKYNARRGNRDRSIGLHAWKIEWFHQSLKKKMEYVAPLPENDIWPLFQI
ncbi:MAG: RNA pseudouridine synthase [Saprospiraceae bacterium]|nr:RNA pseudouridine synthase [Saprospiraceae bacterium]